MADKQFDCIYENQNFTIIFHFTPVYYNAGFLASVPGNYQ